VGFGVAQLRDGVWRRAERGGCVWSIVARLVPAAGGGECVNEFATGYDDGTVRVWRADGCAEDGGEQEVAVSAGPLLPEELGCTNVPRRYVDIPGNAPSCISASADERWLVFCSFQGVVCVGC
jgi:hypothetical protein